LRIAVTKRPVARDIGAQTLVQDRRARLDRCRRIDESRQRLIVHLDEIDRVLGEIAVARHDDSDRLADIAHAFDRDGPALHWALDGHRKAQGQARDIGPYDHGRDTRCGLRQIRADLPNVRMCIG